MQADNVKWAAELSGVKEVSLLGVADLDYWQQWLACRGVVPVEHEGKARIMITGAAGRFGGVRFSELSFSVLVLPPRGVACGNCVWLLQAYNSRRFFAFCERVFFSTPYQHGEVQVAVSPVASIALCKRGQVVFRACMESTRLPEDRDGFASGEETWEGAVLVPDKAKESKLFFAKLEGCARRSLYRHGDSLTLEPTPSIPIVDCLKQSRFVPAEWVLREKASHSKSRTYKCAGE